MTIDEIYRKEKLSVRSYNVCIYNELNSIYDIKEYFNKHKSFDNLKNCGSKSNEELIQLCRRFYLSETDLICSGGQEETKENSLQDLISKLTRIQREVINSFILINTNNLSVRSKNAISLYLNGNLKIKNISEKIFLSERFSLKRIKSIGDKSVYELEKYLSVIEDFLLEVSKSKDEKYLISLKNSFLIQRTFAISKIPKRILESESIFLLTDFLLNQNVLYDEVQTVIAKKAFKIYQNQKELTLENIAAEVNLTKERVRQIRKICLDELYSKLSFIQNFNDDLLQKYNIDVNAKQIEIDTELVDIINNTNITYLSREFITYILFSYLHSTFSLVGNIEDVIQSRNSNARNRHNWNNLYLIETKLFAEVDFIAFVNDVDSRLKDRIEESYFFNFKSYLSRFLTNNNIEILNFAFSIVENIINEEFELYLDLDENIVFKEIQTNKHTNMHMKLLSN